MPALSVIIPTADRQSYAEASARQALAAWHEIEVVIADSSAANGLADALADVIESGRLVYRRTQPGIDVVSNFEGAIDHASADYVLFMGDDDFIGPDIDRIIAWARHRGADAVVAYGNSFLASYFWPGVVSRFFGTAYAGRLFVYDYDGRAHRLNPVQALKDALRNFGHGLGLMPRAYHGIVSRSLIARLREKYGRLFGGVSPDIFSATLISIEADHAYFVSFPFCVPGASPKSTAGLGAARTDRSALYTNPHIAPFRTLVWDPLIPEFYSPTTVWSFSFKQAVDVVGRADLRPNLPRLYARCLLRYWHYRVFTWRALRDYARGQGWIKVCALVGYELVAELGRQAVRILARLRHPSAKGSALAEYRDLNDVTEAAAALRSHVCDHGPAFDPS